MKSTNEELSNLIDTIIKYEQYLSGAELEDGEQWKVNILPQKISSKLDKKIMRSIELEIDYIIREQKNKLKTNTND